MCSVLCFKPFKISFSVSCGLYRDNERNKKTCLSCCKIQPGEIPWFRCPLQTAPVRTEGLFWRPHGCNIAAGTAPVPEAVAEVFQSFQKKFFRRGFLLSPDNSELYLCMPKIFSAYEGTARSPQVRRKIRGGKIFEKSMPNLRYGFRGWVVSLCNITTMRAPKQTLGTDWSGLERTSEPRYFTQLYLAA